MAIAAVADRRDGAENEGDITPAAVRPDDPDVPFDEAAEAAFLSEARERGEVVATARPAESVEEVVDSKALPPLDELVKRIPPEVRETLEDLFRAKFVTVRRVPAKALNAK